MQKPNTLIKPTTQTPFHIDYSWWERNPDDLRTYLLSHLSQEQRAQLSKVDDLPTIDVIDPSTGEVSRVDALHAALRTAARQPDFITQHTSLVESIFRIFLANDNTPMTPSELSDVLGRDANSILKMLSGGTQIYRGIRPVDPTETT